MAAILQDFRYALRTLTRSPGLTLVIVASLAIGIGANSAIFSVVNALLLKPLPYPEPDRLAVLWLRSPGINIPQDWPSPGQFIDIRTENQSFAEMSISQGGGGTLLGRDQPERVEVLRTSSSLFHLLGASPLHGRLLLPEDDVPGKAPVVVLSYGFWRRSFNADPGIVGQSITLNGVVAGSGEAKNQFTVVGVLRPEFMLNGEVMQTVGGTVRMDIYLPLPLGADAVNAARRRELQPDGAPQAGRDDGPGAGGRRDDCRAYPGQGQTRQDVHDQRRAAARAGRRQRPPRRARAARIGGAGPPDRVRQRRQPAPDPRHDAAEGSGDPNCARRALAAAGAAVADGKHAARRPWRSARAARCPGEPVRRAHGQPRQHPSSRRDRHRPDGAGVHVCRLGPDRHRVRPGPGAARRQGRSQQRPEGGRTEHSG